MQFSSLFTRIIRNNSISLAFKESAKSTICYFWSPNKYFHKYSLFLERKSQHKSPWQICKFPIWPFRSEKKMLLLFFSGTHSDYTLKGKWVIPLHWGWLFFPSIMRWNPFWRSNLYFSALLSSQKKNCQKSIEVKFLWFASSLWSPALMTKL